MPTPNPPLHDAITAQQLNPQPTPTPVLPTDAPKNPDENFNNQNWNTFTASPAAPSVPSSVLDNPGVVSGPPGSSPNVAPFTHDPAFTVAGNVKSEPTYEWPDGSWRNIPYDQVWHTENLFYGTGPLYFDAGGFGGPVNNPGGIGPGNTYNISPFNPGVGFKLVPNNSPYK
jgi:hypothetical protein